MALPFYVRAVPFAIASEAESFFAVFGPFPANKNLMVRALRLQVNFSDPTLESAVQLRAVLSGIQLDVLTMPAVGVLPPLFQAESLQITNAVTSPANMVDLDIPCYYLPRGDYPYIVVSLTNSVVGLGPGSDIAGILAPVIDFNYDNTFDASRLVEKSY